MLSTNTSWPLNCDLCISNPLIMFILSPNPSIPRSCPSVQVSAASDLPVHHEVAFVQLWPHLLGRATLPQPFCRQDGPLLRSPWQPWLQKPSPFDLNRPPLTLTQPNSDLSTLGMDQNLGQLWTPDGASTLAKSPVEDQQKPDDSGLLKGLVWVLV